MSYSVDLREKAIGLLKKGKSNTEVAKDLELGKATLYRWKKKKASGESVET